MKTRKLFMGMWALAWAGAGAAFFGLRADNARLRVEMPEAVHAAAVKAKVNAASGIIATARQSGEDDDDWKAAWRGFCRKLAPEMVPQLLVKTGTAAPADRDWMLTQLLGRWTEVKGVAAMRYAQAHLSADSATEVLRQWAMVDPRAATAWAQAQPAGPARDQFLVATLFWLAGKDPPAAMAVLPDIVATQAQGNISLTTRAYTRVDALAAIFYQWTLNDSAGAMAQAEQLPFGWQRNAAVQGIADSGGGADPLGVLTWANGKVETLSYMVSAVLDGILWRLTENDPTGTLNLVLQMPEGKVKSVDLGTVMGHWAEIDAPSAVTAAENLTEGKKPSDWVSLVVRQWAWQDPQAAAAYVKAMPEGPGRDQAVAAFVDTWAQAEPAVAGQWALTLPEGAERASALKSVVDHWVNDGEAEDSAQWLEGVPAGASRDTAVAEYARLVSPTYPMLAGPLVEGLGDEDARDKAIVQVAESWLKLNRPEAESWLAGTSLPEEEKAKLLGK